MECTKAEMLKAMDAAGYVVDDPEDDSEYLCAYRFDKGWVFVCNNDMEGWMCGLFYEPTVSCPADFSMGPVKEWELGEAMDEEMRAYAEGYAQALVNISGESQPSNRRQLTFKVI